MLGIIGAMDVEVKELCSILDLKEVTEIAGIRRSFLKLIKT